MENQNTKIIGYILITSIYLALMYFFVVQVEAEYFYNVSQDQIKTEELELANNNADTSLKLNPNEPRYFYNKAKVQLLSGAPKEDTLKSLKKAQQLNLKNIVTQRNVIPFYYFLAFKDLKDLETTPTTFDFKYFEEAKKFAANLKNTYPNDAGILVLVAKYEKKLGLTNEFGNSIKRIGQLRPDLLKWHPDLISR